jgi:hypothetical protein
MKDYTRENERQVNLLIQNAFDSEMVSHYNKKDRCVKLSSSEITVKFLELLAE